MTTVERLRARKSPFEAAERMARRMGAEFVLNERGRQEVEAAKGKGPLVNPDGPEAADLIDQLQRDNAALREGLAAIERTTFIGVTTDSEQTRRVALESAHDLANALLNPSNTGGRSTKEHN